MNKKEVVNELFKLEESIRKVIFNKSNHKLYNHLINSNDLDLEDAFELLFDSIETIRHKNI